MDKKNIDFKGSELLLYNVKNLVIGSGCAGFNAADWLYSLGEKDTILVTEGVNMGTSRNTGSDKQTYYKLSLASNQLDSIRELASTLYKGGGVNGDNALAEAAGSVKAFFKLVNLGVPFPTNQFGEYVGYKTDHDPRQRATSAGPLTSKYMTEALEKEVNRKGITVLDNLQVVKLFTGKDRIIGAAAIDREGAAEGKQPFVLFKCQNIIMATGGPAAVYHSVVYPESQTGSTGMALEAGALASNLNEWQYGLASTKFRWNVSGTYQQVLPRYLAVEKGGKSREFLLEYFKDPMEAVNMVFLKGYQWPFDSAKIIGSSLIDLIVHHEIFEKGNRVFMDFRENPSCLSEKFLGLNLEAYSYLANSGALLPTPIERLQKMNPQAIALYKNNGIDLFEEPLEVSVCAQHNNGGIGVDLNWQSSIPGLYVVGEAAGTFGVYRPGGSALNSTQVGSQRAAEHISYKERQTTSDLPGLEEFLEYVESGLRELLEINNSLGKNSSGKPDIITKRVSSQKLMSTIAAHVRSPEKIGCFKSELMERFKNYFNEVKIAGFEELPDLLKNRDILITQISVLDAMERAAEKFGSRGSCLVKTEKGRGAVLEALGEMEYVPEKKCKENVVVYTSFEKGLPKTFFKTARPIPEEDDWFERVWADFVKKTGKLGEQRGNS